MDVMTWLKVNDVNEQLAEKTNQINANATNIATHTSQISSLASGSPKGTYATVSALTTAFPTGNTNIYVTADNGNWNYWNGSAWTPGGVYQSTSFPEVTNVRTNSEGRVFNTATERINAIENINAFTKDAYGDFDTLASQANFTIAKADYSVMARQTANAKAGYIKKFKIKLLYAGATIKLVKFDYNGSVVSNVVEDTVSYNAIVGDNTINPTSKFFVECGKYVGIKLVSATTNVIRAVYPYNGVNFIGLDSNNALKPIVNNFAFIFDFTVTDSITFDMLLDIKNNKTDIASILASSYWYGKHYVGYGDSITAGYNLTGYTEDPATNLAETYVKKIATELGMTFNNYGASGRGYSISSTWNLYNILGAYHPTADLVTIAMGTNDFGLAEANSIPFGTIADTTGVSFCGWVRMAFDRLISYYPDAVIIIITPIPRPNMMTPNSYGKTLLDYTDAIKSIAAEYSFPVLDMTRYSNMNVKTASWLTTYMPDNLHLNALGQEKKMKPKIKKAVLDNALA